MAQGLFNRLLASFRILTTAAAITVLAVVPSSDAFAAAQTRTPARATVKAPVKQATPAKKAKKARTAAQRRAAAARARAAAQARELVELRTPRFTVDDSGREVPVVRAAAAIVYDPVTHEILYETNAQDQRSIASITKVMTALVFLESEPELSDTVLVTAPDVRNASVTYLRRGARVSKGDLVNLLLIGSDNAAARVLARVSPYGAAGFIDQMNLKAVELGLEHTRYADPSGLLATNLSSAYDMARLISHAAAHEEIGDIMRKPRNTVRVGTRTVDIRNTNQFLRTGEYNVVGGKTGFIRRAGYCFATLLRLPQSGQEVAVVVLGAPSSASRFWATRHLFNWMSARAEAAFRATLGGVDDEGTD